MHLKYKTFLAFTLFSFKIWAQNLPNSETYPYGNPQFVPSSPDPVSGTDPNTVYNLVPKIPINDTASVNINISAANAKQQVTYLDGFQKMYVGITKNASNVGGQLKHIVLVSDNRAQRDQCSYLPYSTTSSNAQLTPFTSQRSYINSNYPNENYSGYSKTSNTSTSSQYSSTFYLPGKSQLSLGRGTQTNTVTNNANEVRIWGLDATDKPVCNGFYTKNELIGQEVIQPGSNGNQSGNTSPRTKIYKDRDGKTILKLQADTNSIQGSGPSQTGSITWQATYYVYDEKGSLRYTIPPLATQNVEQNGGVLSPEALMGLCFESFFDNKGRQIATKMPGESDYTYNVYDRKDRIVMRQTPNERNNSEWEITLYDGLNRIKESLVYTDNQDRNTWQTLLDAGANNNGILFYLTTPAGENAYKDDYSSFQNDPSVMVINYYDNYSFGTTLTAGTSFISSDLVTTSTAVVPVQSLRTQGLLTKSFVRILRSPSALNSPKVPDYRQTIFNYDDKRRIIYTETVERNFAQTMGHSVNKAIQYDFSGKVLLVKSDVFNSNNNNNSVYPAGQPSHREWTKNNYDVNTGALIKTLHKIDDNAWVTLISYTYDDMGRVKSETLGDGGEVRELTYNIRGMLNGINSVYAETGNKGGYSKTFGESLKYDYGFTKDRLDGKLAGIIWRGSSVTDKYAYGYDYNLSGSLISADFNHSESGGWSNQSIDYSVSNLTYDKNGNIQTMNQRGVSPSGPYDLDILSYSYEGGNNFSNHLATVNDQTGISGNGYGDFEGNSNYSYDPNGNLLSDDGNKKIQGDITYTRFNKPISINFADDKSIEYSYDALGNKVQELVKDGSTQKYKETDYVGNFVYQNIYDYAGPNALDYGGIKDTLQYILNPQGRTIIDPLSNVAKEEYFVKDHLGNVRSVIDVTSYLLHNYLASYELASAHLESLIWDNIDDVRDIRPGGDGDNSMAANLNGGDQARIIGTSILMHVMAGDKVSMNVSTYYNGYNAAQDSPLSASTVQNSIISTLTGGVGGLGGSESHNTKIVQSVFNTNNYTAYNNIIGSNIDATKPKAFLNYALFDENMHLVNEMSGAFQATGNGTWTQIGTTSALEVPANGYLAVYISNISYDKTNIKNSDVYFDQLQLAISHGNLLEENHYYPFGLPIAGLGSTTTDVDYKTNRYKYQSNEYITDQNLNWMSFGARQYDPQIGRFLSVDPMASEAGQDIFSSYAAMGNIPESTIDPDGMSPRNNGGSQYLMAAQTGAGDMGHGGGGPGSGGNGNPLDADFNDILNTGMQTIANMASMQAMVSNAVSAINEMCGNVGILDENGDLAFEGNIPPPNSSEDKGTNGVYDGGTADPDPKGDGGNGTQKSNYKAVTSTHLNYQGRVDVMNGMIIDITYSGDLSGYEKTNWVQNYKATSKQDDGKLTADGESPPTYYSWGTMAMSRIGGNKGWSNHFHDEPGRMATLWNYYWEAEVSLVGYKNGSFHTIATFTWGYLSPAPGVIVMYPVTVSTPSQFQQNLINSLKP